MSWYDSFRKIIDDENVSIATVATLMGSSKTTAHRVLKGQISGSALERFRPIIRDRLLNYFQTRGCTYERALEKLKPLEEDLEMIADRTTLSADILRHFGLKYDPFDSDRLPGEVDVFLNKDFTAVVNRISDAILYQRFVAVIGDVGSGKTLLKRIVTNELTENGRAIIVYPEFFDMAEITVGNIASQILSSLNQPIPRDKAQRVVRIRQVLSEYQQDGVAISLVIDEAHRLADPVLSSLKNFWELTNGRHARLIGVVLFGQPALIETRLRAANFREIRQRVQIIQMPTLSKSASEYLRHRITAAGGDFDKLFSPEAVKRLAAQASTPLALGNLAAGALMSAFALDEISVTPDLPFFRNLPAGGVMQIRRAAAK